MSQLQGQAVWLPARWVGSSADGPLGVVIGREHDADAPFTPPDYVTMLPRLAGHNVQGYLVRDARRAYNFQGRACGRQVTHCALDFGAMKLVGSSTASPAGLRTTLTE
jgi:hypothetical protein